MTRPEIKLNFSEDDDEEEKDDDEGFDDNPGTSEDDEKRKWTHSSWFIQYRPTNTLENKAKWFAKTAGFWELTYLVNIQEIEQHLPSIQGIILDKKDCPKQQSIQGITFHTKDRHKMCDYPKNV